MNNVTHGEWWPTGQNAAVWVLVSWAKMVLSAVQKQSIPYFDQHFSSATHTLTAKLHDTKDTHIHTCAHTLIPLLVIRMLMWKCIIS